MAGDNFQKYENQLGVFEADGPRAFAEDLTQGVDHHRIVVRVSGSVTIVDPGGGAAGTVVQDGPARLLDWRVEQDGFDFVKPGTNGRDLLQLNKRLYPRLIGASTVANGNAQVATAISAFYEIPFTSEYLANPFDMFFPDMPVKTSRRVHGAWNREATNADSSNHSGSIISGGTMEVTVNNLQVEVVEVFTAPSFDAAGNRIRPLFIPVIGVDSTAQFVAANAALPYKLDTASRVLAHLFMVRDGDAPLNNAFDGLNGVTLEGGQVTQNRSVTYATARDMERAKFTGIPTTEVGTLMNWYADNGRLGNALYPSQMGSRPRLLFDVDVPVASPGIVDILAWELVTRPGYTRGV